MLTGLRRTLMSISLMIIIMGGWSCKSKKSCANFEDPKRAYKNSYNKSGLVKKKGVKSKPAWDNR